MKDQLALLRKCIVNDIPAIVFQGDDSCTVEVLEAAIEIYRRHGASREFLYDFQNVIDDVKAYQIQNPHRLKLADMTEVEKEKEMFGVESLKEFIDGYESSRFTQISETEAIITSEYNMNHIVDWIERFAEDMVFS